MKKYFKYMVSIALLGLCLTSCKEEGESIIPSDITNLRAESAAGKIILRWNTPDDGTIRYIQIDYYDPLLKKDVMKTASVYGDSAVIPDTRKKYGDYIFKLQTVSSTGNSGKAQEITQKSEAALPTFVTAKIPLKAADMSTNAQEPTEGPIANLIDGNNGNFFHSSWSIDIPGPHWFQATLNQTVSDHYKFTIVARNGSNRPSDVDLMGSADGATWFLIRNFNKEQDGLSTLATYDSQTFKVEKPFSYIKFVVNKTNTNSIFFTAADFSLYNVSITDPEAPDVE